MANLADAAPVSGKVEPPARPSIRGMLAQTEIDLRLFGMLIALAVILLVFHALSGGKLIQPANMTTLAVQAAAIAIIATGMVLVIVSRNIDLSVGSLVGIIAMTYALLMTDWLPAMGLGSDVPFFLHGGCAVGRGRGDLLEPLPLPAPASLWFVVVVPDVRIPAKTAALYARLGSNDFSDG